MARSQTVSTQVDCWKEHVCVACNTPFRYRLRRRVTATANSEQRALNAAEQQALEACQRKIAVYPCPTCGVVQPEMIEHQRRRLLTVALMLGLTPLAIGLVCGLSRIVSIPTSVHIAVGATLFLSLTFRLGLAINPNRNLAANQRVARRHVAKQRLACEPSNEIVSGVAAPRTTRGWPQIWGCRLLFCLPLLAAAPEAVRWVAGWPSNPDLFPNVIGPGDAATITVADKIQSINGLWSGESVAWVLSPAKLATQLPRLHGRTSSKSWGREFEGRWIGNRPSRLWAQIRVPPDQSLSGQSLQLRLVTNVRFPQEITRPRTPAAAGQSDREPADDDGERGWYLNRQRRFESRVTMQLAEPSAGAVYRSLWQFGQCAILTLAALVGLVFVGLTRIYAQQRPTQVYLRPTSGEKKGTTSRKGKVRRLK